MNLPDDITYTQLQALARIRDGKHLQVNPSTAGALAVRGYVECTRYFRTGSLILTDAGEALLQEAGL